jgi:peroxiredoxin Q/BCP
VLGVSPDDIPTHQRFAASLRLGFPLLSDGDKRVAAAYDAVVLGGAFFDRKTFVIDKTGVIRYVHRGFPSMDDLLAILRQIEGKSQR